MRIKYLILTVFLLFISFNLLHAQPPPPPPQDIPLDGGLLLLILAGVGLAYKKMRSSKEK